MYEIENIGTIGGLRLLQLHKCCYMDDKRRNGCGLVEGGAVHLGCDGAAGEKLERGRKGSVEKFTRDRLSSCLSGKQGPR